MGALIEIGGKGADFSLVANFVLGSSLTPDFDFAGVGSLDECIGGGVRVEFSSPRRCTPSVSFTLSGVVP